MTLSGMRVSNRCTTASTTGRGASGRARTRRRRRRGHGRLDLVQSHAIDGDPFVETFVVVDVVDVVEFDGRLVGLAHGLFDLSQRLFEEVQLVWIDELDFEHFGERLILLEFCNFYQNCDQSNNEMYFERKKFS